MEKSGFFNSVNKDRTYLAEDFAKYFSLVVANGVFPQSADWLKVKPAGGMTVALSLGYAWINGYNYQNDSDKVFTLDVADGSSDRIDSIMVRWSKADRKITSVLVKGNISSDPVAPSVQRDGDYYDLKVANIKVDAGITQIEERHIEDTRFDSSVCGIVAGAVKQIDTTDLFSQYDDAFKELMKTVEDTLSGDVAGNLLVNIETHKADTEVHLRRLSYAKSGTTHQLTGLTAVSGVVSCVFTATADFAAGDTVTVDGEAYAVQMPDGEAAPDKLFTSGVSVSVVVDKTGKKVNFKSAGGVKLPAGTFVIVDWFMNNGTFVVPMSGTYRITVVGHGGAGGKARYDPSDSKYYGGGGGGSGGACYLILDLVKGAEYSITVTTSLSSFGSLLTAESGKNASNEMAGDYGASSGGVPLTCRKGDKGFTNDHPAYYGTNGGDGGYISGSTLFKGTEIYNGAYRGYEDAFGGFSVDSNNNNSGSNFLFYPFGVGGGGGAHVRIDDDSYTIDAYGSGGDGGHGAVIIELLLKGVNDT